MLPALNVLNKYEQKVTSEFHARWLLSEKEILESFLLLLLYYI